MSFAALVVAGAALVVLAATALSFWGGLVLAAVAPKRPADPEEAPAVAVDILVPARDEGDGVLACVESLLAQDHARVEIHVLVEDERDTSAVALASRAQDPRVHVRSVGRPGKAEKLNLALPTLTAPFVAILDADHVADPDWIRRSLATLTARDDCVAVQGERRPLRLGRLSALWDSAQNHVGNECLDRARVGWGLPVFFTGTTGVFRREALAARGFGESVTEDTELSLELILEGAQIAKLQGCGSREEVAPDLRSYCHRRRRWSAGHTEVFARRLARVWSSTAGRARVALLAHGAFYLVPLLVLLLLATLSTHLLAQLRTELLVAALLISASLGVVLCRALTGAIRAVDVVVTSAWIVPQVALFAPFALRRWGDEHAYFLVSFPLAELLDPIHAVLALTPLAFVIAAHALVPRLGWPRVLVVVVTYPLMLACDLVAITLGLVDAARGVRTWPQIQRGGESRARLWVGFAALAVGSGAAVALVHDVDTRARCAPEESWVLPIAGPALRLETTRARVERTLVVRARAIIERVEGAETRFLLDGAVVRAWSTQAEAQLPIPLGWRSHLIEAEVRGRDVVCRAERAVSSTSIEIEGPELRVNGEPFVIKGIIPSFQTARVGLDPREGFEMLHALGANTVRLYHAAHASVAEDAQAAGLVIFDQPDQSTWENTDITERGSAERLVANLVQLEHLRDVYPNVLMHLIGNELEIKGGARPAAVASAIELARERLASQPFSYSTYYLYLDYAPPILGINMLDSGRTYWRGGLDAVRARGRAFFASELGGFVAFSERPPPPLAAWRLGRQWRELGAAGAAGAIVFQSHDNWAQPVPEGLNDPFRREHADDTRGLWTVEGAPTPRVDVVASIFADLELECGAPWISADARSATARLRNVRPYAVTDVELRWSSGALALRVGALEAGEVREVELALALDVPLDVVEATFKSHRGLAGRARVFTGLVRPREPRARFVGRGFVRSGEDATVGWGLSGGYVDAIVPVEWGAAEVRGARLGPGRHRVSLPSPLRPLEVERLDERGVTPFQPTDEDGLVVLRVRTPEVVDDDAWLIFDGVGATRIELAASSKGPWQSRDSHAYRELLIPTDELPKARDGWTYARVQRSARPFIVEEHHPRGVATEVVMSRPRLFAPARLTLARSP